MHQFVKASARINFAKEWHWFKSENKINSDGWAGGLSWCYSGALQPQPVYLIYDATLRHRGVSVLWAIKARIQKYDARLPNWPDMCQNKDVWTKLGQKSGIYWGSQEWEETPELALHSGMEISSLVNCVLVVVLLTPLLHNFMCLLSTLLWGFIALTLYPGRVASECRQCLVSSAQWQGVMALHGYYLSGGQCT